LQGSRLFEIICSGRRVITGERGVYSLYDEVAKGRAEIESLEHRIGVTGQTKVREWPTNCMKKHTRYYQTEKIITRGDKIYNGQHTFSNPNFLASAELTTGSGTGLGSC